MLTRLKSIAGLATLALAGASSGVALGHGTYFVKFLHVPTTGVDGQPAYISVHAHADKLADLSVFTSRHTCAANAELEYNLKRAGNAHLLIRAQVHGDFVRRDHFFPGQGTYHACAYLYLPSGPTHTVDRAVASWHVK
jgi:hypothetical protein